eukprot:scaffold15339_cov35-Tisochrysis_lutea.AAC.1
MLRPLSQVAPAKGPKDGEESALWPIHHPLDNGKLGEGEGFTRTSTYTAAAAPTGIIPFTNRAHMRRLPQPPARLCARARGPRPRHSATGHRPEPD